MPPMVITFGKHNGKDARRIVVQHPDYFIWCEHQPSGAARGLGARMRKLVDKIDAAPFAIRCLNFDDCGALATRFSLYASGAGASPEPYFWCAKCSPYSWGASSGNLTIGSGFDDMAQFSTWNAMGRTGVRFMIRSYASAKGLPSRLTVAALDKFFG